MAQNVHQSSKLMLHSSTLVDVVSRPYHFIICLICVVKLVIRQCIFHLMFKIPLVKLKLGGFCLKHAFSLEPMDFLKAPNKPEKFSLIFMDVNVPTSLQEQSFSIENCVLSARRKGLSGSACIMEADKR